MIEIGLGHYLTLGAIIFTIGIVGIFLNRKNIIVILMSIELILLSVNINLVSFSIFTNDLVGQIFTLFILIVIGKTLSKTITWTGVGSIDKSFGLLFGVFKGYVVCVCLPCSPRRAWGVQ